MANHAYFLPDTTPEEIIWSDEAALKSLEQVLTTKPEIDAAIALIASKQLHKDKFEVLCQHIYTGQIPSDAIYAEQRKFITRLVNSNDHKFTALKDIILSIRDTANI